MVFGKRIVLATMLVALTVMFGLSSATAEVTLVRVLGGRTDQTGPAANAAYLGFTANTADSPSHYDAYAKKTADSSVAMLNTGGSGWFGGVRPDSNEAIYQQYNRKDSNLHVIDLDTTTRTSPGTGINTSHWEFDPSISLNWILFGRITNSQVLLILYHRIDGSSTVLDSVPYPGNGLIRPGTVTEKYATWTHCGKTSCNVVVYDLIAHTTSRVPNPNKRYFYYGSASDTSNKLYFVRSGNGCGLRVRIQSWNIGTADPLTTVASLPDGFDVATRTFTFVNAGHDDVYFDRLRCSGKFYSDLFKAPSAEI
jgi:hypothetical protein